MKAYKPSEHSATTSVAPLVQFFELVHIGDTIQSIMQVYFDKELVSVSVLLPFSFSFSPCSFRPARLGRDRCLMKNFNYRHPISTRQIS